MEFYSSCAFSLGTQAGTEMQDDDDDDDDDDGGTRKVNRYI